MFRLRRYLRGHYLECVLAPTMKGLEAILQLLAPLVMAQVIDVGIANRDARFVLWHGLLLVGIGVFCYVVAIVAQYYSSKLAAQFGTALRDDLFRHVMTLSREDIDRLGKASLITRITNDSQQTQDGLNMFLRLILRSPFIIVGTVIAAFLVDGWEGACLLVSTTACVATVLLFMRVTSRRYRRIQQGLDDVLLKTDENLEGARVLRAFRREPAEKDAFSTAANGVRDLQVSTGDVAGLVNPITYALVNCGLIALLWVGGCQVQVGSLSQGQLVALVSYVSQALVELLKLTNLITMLAKAQACAGRINEVFDTAPTQVDGTLGLDAIGVAPAAATTKRDAPPEAAVASPVPAIEFRDVSFAYPGAGGEALTCVSFSLEPGQTLGIIGGTGSGKTTVANLAMRFYDATSGSVRVFGHDVRELRQRDLRQIVGLVEQGPRLFSGTIGSNLRWGKANATDDELAAAVGCAQADDVVASKPEGLAARVEQYGRNFSGGQRQRLAIARTVVRRPRVLVLDDASSALDFATDAALRRSVRREFAGDCVITISQRVTAMRGADRILVLDGGRVAGLGTHDELLRDCGVYREICESQLTEEEVSR
ncbi:ABC transporter ATP-binding protein [Atopobiaceae bacterium SGI.236]